MSDRHQVIEFQWPNDGKKAWPALQEHIETKIRRKDLKPTDDNPVQVTASFGMSQSDDMWHTKEPGIDSLVTKLLYCLHESGLIDDLCVIQLNIGKLVPGPNASKTAPGVRISILTLE